MRNETVFTFYIFVLNIDIYFNRFLNMFSSDFKHQLMIQDNTIVNILLLLKLLLIKYLGGQLT